MKFFKVKLLIWNIVLIINAFDFIILRVGGSNLTTSSPIPFTVALTMSKRDLNYSHFCTGVIVDKRLILTTTECIQYSGNQFKPEEINVTSAAVYVDDNTDSETHQYTVKNIFNIQNGRPNEKKYSLLQLETSITSNQKFGRKFSKPQFTITGGENIKPAHWCKKMGVKIPRKLHVRFGRKNCGTTGLFRGNFIYYICMAGKFFSTEFCYGFVGDAPILFKDFLIGFKIPLPW